MGRKRKETDKWMPVRVYRGRSAFEYRPIKGVCVRLCPLDTAKHVVIRRHSDEYTKFHTKAGTIESLVELFFRSADFRELSARTRKDYETYWKSLHPVFAHVDSRSLEPVHMRKYMDAKGQQSKVTANRHLAFMSRVYGWGFERGEVLANPCKGVRRFTETARTVYITDAEYQAVYDAAPSAVRVAMEISYLCAARQGDVLKLKKSQLLKDGIFIKQGKTGKEQIKLYSPRLKKALALAAVMESEIESMYVIKTRAGTAYTSDGFRTMWHKAKAKAKKKTGLPLDFTFHDLKAKSISDYEGNKQEFSGHKTAAMAASYDRKTQSVESLNLPNIFEGKKAK